MTDPSDSPRLPGIRSVSGAEDSESPFNFTPTYFTPATPKLVSAARTNQRRGHRYKHSSVSMNFFQPPEERAPLAIPISLPVPNFVECYQSVTQTQFLKLLWCVFKIIVTVLIYSIGSPGVHSVSTLSHLLAYETLAETTITLIGILANFDVWKTSSLRFPFALKRVEVLVAFALAAVLMFVGGDVMSHAIQEFVNPEMEHSHNHQIAPSKSRHLILIFFALLISFPSYWRDGSQNLLAFATFCLAALSVFVPLLPHTASKLLDGVLTPCIAVTMIVIGWFGVKMFGGMLAMSYGGVDVVPEIRSLILKDKSVESVNDIGMWQVHHDLWQATMRIRVHGSENETRVREIAEAAVRSALPLEDVTWDTTIEVSCA